MRVAFDSAIKACRREVAKVENKETLWRSSITQLVRSSQSEQVASIDLASTALAT
jgi:hypothetical protein